MEIQAKEKPGFFSKIFKGGQKSSGDETREDSTVNDKKSPLSQEIIETEEILEIESRNKVPNKSELQIDEVETKQSNETDASDSYFKRLRQGISRSSSALTSGISEIFTKSKLDSEMLQDLEDILLQADLGTETAVAISDTLSKSRYEKAISDIEVRELLASEIENVLKPVAIPLEIDPSHKPHVILMVGVNGTGKTTTIGKLASKFSAESKSIILVAGDTFRAAAVEQLKVWGERTGSQVISGKQGADSAGLAFDAMKTAREQGADILLIDTAGRLQNKVELMEELKKVIRVIKKYDESAPHSVLLTLDATTGQNALSQVEIFKKDANVTGLVLTKLDGTARGGILVAISRKHKLPVHFIGIGEKVSDLDSFSAKDFSRAIAGLDEEA